MSAKHIVIVGGGFAGLTAAKKLLSRNQFKITLIDRTNHHAFQPLLYQVATAGLSPAQIATPIRTLLASKKNVEIIMGEVREINKDHNTLTVSSLNKPLSYDYLIVAAGATYSYFGNDHWAQYAPGLKTVEDALDLRRRILTEFERAEAQAREGEAPEPHFVVVGGGPTGLEVAGAIAELAQFTLRKDYKYIQPAKTKIYIVEGGERLMSVYHPDLSAKAKRSLEKMGVTVKLGHHVSNIEPHHVTLNNGEVLSSHCVIWAAGVRASTLAEQLSDDRDRAGKVKVKQTLQLPSHENIFVIGDIAHCAWGDRVVPGVAPAAMQMGRHVAKNVLLHSKNLPLEDFEYFDKGSLATIGRHAAVGEVRGLKLSGWLAWIGWLVIHLFYLVGFKNRIFVLFDWLISYLFYGRGARLITKTFHAHVDEEKKKHKRDVA